MGLVCFSTEFLLYRMFKQSVGSLKYFHKPQRPSIGVICSPEVGKSRSLRKDMTLGAKVETSGKGSEKMLPRSTFKTSTYYLPPM